MPKYLSPVVLRSPGNDTPFRMKLNDSIVLGFQVLENTSAPAGPMIAIGTSVMSANDVSTSGGEIVAVGHFALSSATSAVSNGVALGSRSFQNLRAANCVGVGYQAGNALLTGADNTFVGSQAGKTITTGASNVIIGMNAQGSAVGTNNSVAIGKGTSVGTTGAIAIGSGSIANVNYTTAIGYGASTTASGAVAIGTDSTGAAASTAISNDFKFGTTNHNYNFPGKLGPAAGGTLTLNEAVNVVLGTTTGTKWGTLATQKQSWWNVTPVVQSTGWSVTAGYTSDKAFNPQITTLNEVAAVLGTLIDQLKTYGLLGT